MLKTLVRLSYLCRDRQDAQRAGYPRGGGTDAAYAGLKTKAPVVEGFGLQGFGAHSTNAEYILIDSIEPRLYLAARMIMDISQGKAPLQ